MGIVKPFICNPCYFKLTKLSLTMIICKVIVVVNTWCNFTERTIYSPSFPNKERRNLLVYLQAQWWRSFGHVSLYLPTGKRHLKVCMFTLTPFVEHLCLSVYLYKRHTPPYPKYWYAQLYIYVSAICRTRMYMYATWPKRLVCLIVYVLTLPEGL